MVLRQPLLTRCNKVLNLWLFCYHYGLSFESREGIALLTWDGDLIQELKPCEVTLFAIFAKRIPIQPTFPSLAVIHHILVPNSHCLMTILKLHTEFTRESKKFIWKKGCSVQLLFFDPQFSSILKYFNNDLIYN